MRAVNMLLLIGASASIIASMIIAMRSSKTTQILSGFAAGTATAAIEKNDLRLLAYAIITLSLAVLNEQLSKEE